MKRDPYEEMLTGLGISEAQMIQAAKAANDAIEEGDAVTPDGAEALSPEARAAILERIGAAEKRPRRVWKRIALVAASLLLVFGFTLATQPKALAAVKLWVKEAQETLTVFRFHGGKQEQGLPACEFLWLPEGCEAVDVVGEGDAAETFYVFQQKGEMFFVGYVSMAEGMSFSIQEVPDERITVYSGEVNGIKAEFYSSSDEEEENALVWADDARQLFFYILGNLDMETMIRIAENLRLER